MKLLLSIFSAVIMFIWLSIRFFLYAPETYELFEHITYWVLFTLLLLVVWLVKIKGNVVLFASLAIIVVGGILNILDFNDWSEIVLRVFVVFMTVGVIKILSERN